MNLYSFRRMTQCLKQVQISGLVKSRSTRNLRQREGFMPLSRHPFQKGGMAWHSLQNNIPLKTLPLDQAFIFRRQLIEGFREKKIAPPTIGVAACFPDTFFSQQPTQDDLQGLVIGGQDLRYLEKILRDVMERAVPDPRPVKGP
jgi:hypothetical protein